MAKSLVTALSLACAIALFGDARASAQGPGQHGAPRTPPGQANKGTGGTTTTGPRPVSGPGGVAGMTPAASTLEAATIRRSQTFGSWLDNADVSAPREAWLSVSTAYWRSLSLREIDAPAMGMSVGVAPRVQVGLSLPYYHLSDASGFSSHGVGASYITGKLALTTGGAVAAAISPTVEILSWSPSDASVDRVNWFLPVSVQRDLDGGRLYATGGYVSRGSLFGGGAVEWYATPRLTVVGTMTQAYSIKADAEADALAVSKHRIDAGGGAYVSLNPTFVLFANLGRTFAPNTSTSSRLLATAGMAINVAGPATRSPRLP